ncbi:MAG: cobalt ECF transporter T component CbiQ [Chloroflexota bacterium]
MHVSVFDQYQDRPTLIHHLDPRVKVVMMFIYVLSTVMLPDGAWLAFLFSWGVVWTVRYMADIPMEYVLKRSLVMLPFVLAAMTIIFTLPGPPIGTLQLREWQVVISETGVVRFLSILLRSWISIQIAILLVATTPIPDLLHAFVHLRVPKVLVSIVSFMYRYLFVLVDEAMRLLRAREARSAQPLPGKKGSSMLWRARVTGNMAGQLFIRSYDRSDRVYNAMLARGFRGELMTMRPHRMHSQDWVFVLLAGIICLGIQIIGHFIG